MMAIFKDKGYKFYADVAIAVLSVIAVIFFLLSYTTGYIGIVYGQNNSILITIMLFIVLLISSASAVMKILGIDKFEKITDILVLVNTALLIVSLMLLFADRLDAIGNCIIAPWDAGHGGEDSCYLSFVSMGCFIVCAVLNIIGAFVAGSKK